MCDLLEYLDDAEEEGLTQAFSATTGTDPDDAHRTGYISQKPVAERRQVAAVELTELQLPLQSTVDIHLGVDSITVDHNLRHDLKLRDGTALSSVWAQAVIATLRRVLVMVS